MKGGLGVKGVRAGRARRPCDYRGGKAYLSSGVGTKENGLPAVHTGNYVYFCGRIGLVA